MVTKKVRTEYMKKFRDPRWDTFSKCYEDSLRYRLTRRVMEHSHKPWFWEGWDSGSESSGWSTPRLSRNKIVPLSLPPTTATEAKHRSPSPGDTVPPVGAESEAGGGEAAAEDPPPTAVVENGVQEAGSGDAATVTADAAAPSSRPPAESDTDNGPADTPSSDGEPSDPPAPPPGRRHRRRQGPGSEPGRPDSSPPPPPVTRKPPRAKSQPAISTKDSRRTSSRVEGQQGAELRRTANHSNTSDACVQTRRHKRSSDPERRRSRSADLEKLRSSQLTVASDHWVTEYMRCFSARLR